MTRYILAFAKEVTVNSLSTVIAALGGAAITTLFDQKTWLFPSYAIGLAVGYFLHVLLYDIDPKTGEVVYKLNVKTPVVVGAANRAKSAGPPAEAAADRPRFSSIGFYPACSAMKQKHASESLHEEHAG